MLQQIEKKVILVGSPSVGKTAIIQRFVHNKFTEGGTSTLGTKTWEKGMLIDNVVLNLRIWDMSGQHYLKRIHNLAFREADGAVLVGDLSRPETVDNLLFWISVVTNVTGDIPFVVVGNKADLVEDLKELERLAWFSKRTKIPSTHSSAKTGEGIEALFETLGRMILTKSWVPVDPEALPKDVKELPVTETNPYLAVEDEIITGFCESIEDPDLGMAIVRHQFSALQIDYQQPTDLDIARIIERLEHSGMAFVNEERLKIFVREARAVLDEAIRTEASE